MKKDNVEVGYKVFNPDWTCRDMQYKVGETYELEGNLRVCSNGFHYCKNAADCFNYYGFDSKNKVAEIEALGETQQHGDDTKYATDKIKIVREIGWHEVLQLVNTGSNNTGLSNSGDWNSGDSNSGDWNSGDFNSCDFSSGVFCTETPKLLMFDKPTNITLRDWWDSEQDVY